jgi:SAM-dependent methyltransferase
MKKGLIPKMIKKARNFIFPGSALYWEKRYHRNGTSGSGSYGKSAEYKAEFLNRFVKNRHIQSVIEFGCGDGNQATQFDFPSYIGLDISRTAIEKCTRLFKEDHAKRFFIRDKNTTGLKAELAISLDVIYHLIEEEVYEYYMMNLFASATKYVIIYAWDVEEEKKYHVRHRKFTQWIERNIADFQLIERTTKSSYCDFFIYKKIIHSDD